MTTFAWIEGVAGAIDADGKRLEAVAYGPRPDDAPTIVMLHEGLGCVALWRDFPQKLAAATGHGVLAYSRAGYGRSERIDLPRPLDYMSREARFSLPALLEAIGLERGILLGHSDGASIAAIAAGDHADERIKGLILMAPHLFTEEMGLASIAEAGHAYEAGDLRAKLAKYHADVDTAFLRLERRLARSRLQGLEHRGGGRPLARSRAPHPGRRTINTARSSRSAPSRPARPPPSPASFSRPAATRRRSTSRRRRSTRSSGSAPRSRAAEASLNRQ